MKNTPPKQSLKNAPKPQPPAEAHGSATIATFSPAAADVACRAYLKYHANGLKDGHDLADWLGAEAELTEEHGLAGV